MQKQAEINIPELLKTAGENLSIMRQMFDAQKLAAEKGGKTETAKMFRDLLICVDQLQIAHFAVSMVHDENSGNVIKGATFAPNVGGGFAGELIDSLITKIKPGDTLQSFAARELVGVVETIHTFQIDESGKSYDPDSVIAELVQRGENPYTFLIDSIFEGVASAEKAEAESRLLTTVDFHHDAQAFVGGAMGYAHAANLMAITPELIKRLEAYRAA